MAAFRVVGQRLDVVHHADGHRLATDRADPALGACRRRIPNDAAGVMPIVMIFALFGEEFYVPTEESSDLPGVRSASKNARYASS